MHRVLKIKLKESYAPSKKVHTPALNLKLVYRKAVVTAGLACSAASLLQYLKAGCTVEAA